MEDWKYKFHKDNNYCINENSQDNTYKIICKYEHNVWSLVVLTKHLATADDQKNGKMKDYTFHYFRCGIVT